MKMMLCNFEVRVPFVIYIFKTNHIVFHSIAW